MDEPEHMPFGVVAIAVIMFFAAAATDVFWIGRLFGAFPSTMPVPDNVYRAFAIPDILLSLVLYVGAYGLIRLRRFGFVAAGIAMGMWLFDCLLVFGITGLSRVNVIGPTLVFIVFTIVYLWLRRDLFD